MHFIIIIAIIALIVIIQIRFFLDTNKKIDDYFDVFPNKDNSFSLSKEVLIEKINSASDDELSKMLKAANFDTERYYKIKKMSGSIEAVFLKDKAKKDLTNNLSGEGSGISVKHKNEIFKAIVESINDYLKNNKSVSDFHLMKDIVNRNCDSKEDEIATQIPIPLYMGLVGTMAGILIGILYLWLSGGIGNLLNNESTSGADGIEALLGGVALAMISSILGIVLTTWGSNKFKTAKTVIEKNKHKFLSWIQAKLLPTLSDNVVGAIREMTDNLHSFNDKFAINTGNLGTALQKVNESYFLQKQLMESVQRIANKDITSKNLELYNALENSAQEIGVFAQYMQNTNEYLENVRVLNDKLDSHENRTRTIEDIGVFFKKEIEQIEERKGAISKSVGKVDDYLKQALERLRENADFQVSELQKSIVKQQDALHQRVEEIDKIVVELGQLAAIKDSITNFEQVVQLQNGKLEDLTNAIQALAKTKNVVPNESAPYFIENKEESRFQIKPLFWVGSLFGGILLFMLIIANWDSISVFISIFKF